MSPLKQASLRVIGSVGVPARAWMTTARRKAAALAAPTSRAAFLARVPREDVLEIGPFANPVIRGPGVAYFDVLDTAALRRRATEIGYAEAGIPTIDYCSPTGDLSVVDRTFAAVLSSHAIEHQPDLIAHLRGVTRILSPGGRYFVIAPDRRYSFDHYLPESTLADLEAAHRERRRVHTRKSIMEHRLATTHNNPLRHWLGLHGRPAPSAEQRAAAEAEARQADEGAYVDVHAWTFSPASFRLITAELFARGETQLAPFAVHDTGFGDLEFFAVLRKAA